MLDDFSFFHCIYWKKSNHPILYSFYFLLEQSFFAMFYFSFQFEIFFLDFFPHIFIISSFILNVFYFYMSILRYYNKKFNFLFNLSRNKHKTAQVATFKYVFTLTFFGSVTCSVRSILMLFLFSLHSLRFIYKR